MGQLKESERINAQMQIKDAKDQLQQIKGKHRRFKANAPKINPNQQENQRKDKKKT